MRGYLALILIFSDSLWWNLVKSWYVKFVLEVEKTSDFKGSFFAFWKFLLCAYNLEWVLWYFFVNFLNRKITNVLNAPPNFRRFTKKTRRVSPKRSLLHCFHNITSYQRTSLRSIFEHAYTFEFATLEGTSSNVNFVRNYFRPTKS